MATNNTKLFVNLDSTFYEDLNEFSPIITSSSGKSRVLVVSPLTTDLNVQIAFRIGESYDTSPKFFTMRLYKDDNGVQITEEVTMPDTSVETWNVWYIDLPSTALATLGQAKLMNRKAYASFRFRESNPLFIGSYATEGDLPSTEIVENNYATVGDTTYVYNDVGGTLQWEDMERLISPYLIVDTTEAIELTLTQTINAEELHMEASELDMFTQWLSEMEAEFTTVLNIIIGGDEMTRELNMGGFPIENLADPDNSTDAVNVRYLVENYLKRNGDNSMTGNLPMGGNKVVNMADPSLAQDGATKKYVDDIHTDVSQEIDDDIATHNGRADAHPLLRDRITVNEDTLPLKVDKTLTILDIDLQDDITLTEFMNELRVVSQSSSGIMSVDDKKHLDALYSLLGETADADTVVNTINEVLDVFSQYPEGADLVSALAGKVDKVEGYGLSENDFTDALKLKLDNLPTESKLNGDLAFLQSQLDDTYNIDEVDALLDQLKSIYGWENSDLTPTALTDTQTLALSAIADYDRLLFIARVSADDEIDTQNVEVAELTDGTMIEFFNNTNINATVDDTNITFNDVGATETLKIYGIKMTPLDASKVAYNDTTVQAELTNQRLDTNKRLKPLEENYKSLADVNLSNQEIVRVESEDSVNHLPIINAGGIAPHLLLEGRTIPALENKVTNGDFSDGDTGWTPSYASLSLTNEIMSVMAGSNASTGAISYVVDNEIVSEDVYYSSIKVRVTNANAESIIIRYRGSTGGTAKIVHTINNPVENEWYIIPISDTLPSDATGNFRLTIEHNYDNATISNGEIMEVDYVMLFNLNDTHNTSTQDEIDNAVAEIEQQLAQQEYIDTTPITSNLPHSIRSEDESGEKVSKVLMPNITLNRVPNGVADTYNYKSGEYVKRVQEYTLQEGDFEGTNSQTNVDLIYTPQFTDRLENDDNNLITNNLLIDDFESVAWNDKDDIEHIGKFTVVNSSKRIYFIVEKGSSRLTFDNENAGTKIWYQLAEPITTQYPHRNLFTHPKGTLYLTPELGDVYLYDNGITVDKNIDSINTLNKIDQANGVETDLDISLSVITDNSFTHPNISNGDYVWVEYTYTDLTARGTFVYDYYNSRWYKVSPNGTVYKIVETVDDDGNLTRTTELAT